jgi:hypothetical protein
MEFTAFVNGVGLALIALVKASLAGAALAKSRLNVRVPPAPLALASLTIM